MCSLALTLFSCSDYLEKEDESILDEQTAFQNFSNFQGFIEEMYNCIPDKEKFNYCCSFNWGDDEIFNTNSGDSHVTHYFDLGDFKNWYSNYQSWMYNTSFDPTVVGDNDHRGKHPLWQGAWYCIRKANQGLANLDLMTGTEEEKDVIAGQLYFFRAWWYEELIQWFGGLPYIKNRLTHRKRCAIRVSLSKNVPTVAPPTSARLPTCCPTTGTRPPLARRR